MEGAIEIIYPPKSFRYWVYDTPIRALAQGQNDGPPFMNGKYAASNISPLPSGLLVSELAPKRPASADPNTEK